ncbi:nucleoside diphosphate kinase [Trifolium repens]|nr:nucleoside diphosphate kinase [Trifolium repens]
MDSTRKIIKNRFRVHKSTKSQPKSKSTLLTGLLSSRKRERFAHANLADSSRRSLSHQNGHNSGYVDPNAVLGKSVVSNSLVKLFLNPMWMIPWLPPHGDPTKSTYVLLADKFLGEITTAREEISAFKALWNCLAPSKVLCFSWKVLHNRVATRDNLFRREFLAGLVLSGYYRTMVSLLNFVASVPGRKQKRKGLVLIWNAVIWSIWLRRNNIVFENGVTDVNEIVADVKLISWKWWIAKSKAPTCLLYEWIQEPVILQAIEGGGAAATVAVSDGGVGEIISRFEKKSFYLKGLKFLNVERAFAGPVVIWERKNVGFHHHQQINLQIRTAKGVCAGFKGAQENVLILN